jgi:hypothetical protein
MDKNTLLIITNDLPLADAADLNATIKTLMQTTHIHHIELLHVRPYIAAHCYALPSMIDFLEHCEKKAQRSLAFWGEHLNIDSAHQWVSSGNVRQESVRFSRRHHTNFILTSESVKRSMVRKFNFGSHATTYIKDFSAFSLFSIKPEPLERAHQSEFNALAHAFI